MVLNDSATRNIEAVALKFSSELSAIAEDLAREAHSGIDGAEVYEAILSAWEAVKNLHEEYDSEIDSLNAKYFQFGNIGA